MSNIEQILARKERNIWSIAPDESVFDAVKLMDEKGIGVLTVLNENKLVGIISERDCARKMILEERMARETPVKEIMTRKVFHTRPEQDVSECMLVMTRNHIRHLPVLENGNLIGMISLGDVVENIIGEQQDQIKHLEHYLIWEETY